MQACRLPLQAPACAGPGRPGAWRGPERPPPGVMLRGRIAGPLSRLKQLAAGGQRRHLNMAAAAASGGGSGGNQLRSKSGRPPGRTAEPQPELQAWLEQKHGLAAADADQHARRLVAVFGGDQQAALASLPATFAFCGSQGLSGLQTAQLLDRIASDRRDSVVSFAATAQRDWQLIEPLIAVHVRRLQQAGKQLPKRDSLASLLCGSDGAAKMLVMPPGHVAAWLAAVGKLLPDDADVGRLLLTFPLALCADPKTTLAALHWFGEALGVQPSRLAAFAAKAAVLLTCKTGTLQANLAALQEALPPEVALRMVQKYPPVLGSNSNTMREALHWLQRQFAGDAEQLQAVLDRGPPLLQQSADSLQRRADYLQRQLGWQPGDGQLAAFIEAYPQSLATVNFESPDKQALLLLLTGVVGVDLKTLLVRWSVYLKYALETTTARYVLVQERAPWLLYDCNGGLALSWVKHGRDNVVKCGAATKAEVLEFERAWPKGEEGQRLLEAVRSGSTEGWPQPPSWEEALARRQQHVPARSRRAAPTRGKQQQLLGK